MARWFPLLLGLEAAIFLLFAALAWNETARSRTQGPEAGPASNLPATPDPARLLEDEVPLEALLAALVSPDAATRILALEGLARRGGEEARVLESLRDPDERVRLTALRLLAGAESNEARDAMQGVLDSPTASVPAKLLAIEHFRQRGDGAALRSLARAMKDPALPVRLGAFRILAKLDGLPRDYAESDVTHNADETAAEFLRALEARENR